MLHPISKIAAFALTASLAGTMSLATPASATAATAEAEADEPFSSFAVKVTAPGKVRAGGKITYRIKATNKGPHLADSFWTGGALPKGAKPWAVHAPKGTRCGAYQDGFWCVTPNALGVGEYETIEIVVKLSRRTKGTATAYLGVDTVDLPTGAETLNREEFARMGIKHWYFVKKIKTKVAR